MKSIVRGFNKDKHQSAKEAPRPAITPLPNDPSKKMPPKGIIRAIDSFSARNADELSCRKGDFFHLLAEQPGPDGQGWFDATNPLTGARGLVPKEICEILGKTSANKPAGASPSNGIFGMQDLASAVPGATNTHGGNGGGSFGGSSPQTPKTPNSATSNGKAQSLYARVQYDFEAQRPDELDARRGENIIVM